MNLSPCAVLITTTRSDGRISPRATSLKQHGQRHAGVRTGVHAGQVGQRGGVGQLVLAGLLDDAVGLDCTACTAFS